MVETNICQWGKQHVITFAYKSSVKSFTVPIEGRYPEIYDSVAQFIPEACSKILPVAI